MLLFILTVVLDTVPATERVHTHTTELNEVTVSAFDERNLRLASKEAAYYIPIRPMTSVSPSGLAPLAHSVPALQFASLGGHTVKPVLRGLGGYRVVTSFQGIRYDNLQGGPDHGLDMPLLGVHHAEVLLGPHALFYGTDALAGVLYLADVRPISVANKTLTGSLGINPWTSEGSLQYHGTGHRWVPYYSGVLYSHQGEYRDARGETVHGTEATTLAARGLWSWEGQRGAHRIKMSSVERSLSIPTPEEPSDSTAHSHEHQQRISTQNIAWESSWKTLAWKVQSHSGVAHSFRGEEGEEHGTWELAFDLLTLNHTTTAARQWGSWMTTFGAHGHYRGIKNRSNTEERTYPNGHSSFLAGFAQAEKSSAHWTWKIGGRAERGTFPASSALSTLEWHPASPWHAQIRLSSGTRSPQLEERFAFGTHIGAGRFEVGNPALRPEKSTNLDVNGHYLSAKSEIQIGAFLQRYEDFIVLTPSDSSGSLRYYYTATPALLIGAEGKWHVHPQGEKGPWHGAVVAAIVRGQRGKEFSKTADPLAGIPAIRVGMQGERVWEWSPHRHVQWEADVQWVAPQTRLSPDEKTAWDASQTDGYILVSMRMVVELPIGSDAQPWAVALEGHNLTNALYAGHLSYVRALGLYEAGRSIRCTLTLPL